MTAPSGKGKAAVFPVLPVLPVLPIILALAWVPGALSQGGPGCVDTVPFRKEILLENPRDDLREPIRMAFDPDAEGKTDIFLAERGGRVRKYAAASGTLSEVGQVPVLLQYEGGLTGIALDPGFKRNRRIYVGGTFGSSSRMEFQVLRYTLDATGRFDAATRTEVIRFPAKDASHAPVVLRFDRDGNLLAAVGDNTAGENGPASTINLRGKVLRIRPKEDGGYAIPPGNLFEPGRKGTLPEIYVMGVRNAYSMTYEGRTGRIAWGDFGPDATGARTEEHNLTAYGQAASVVGPLYRLPPAGALRALPPSFDGAWFITDFGGGWVDTLRLDAAGTSIKAQGRLRNLKLNGPIDFQQGPDGALYAVEYAGSYAPSVNSKVVRLQYQGCAPPVGVAGGRKRISRTREYRLGPLQVTVGGDPRDIAGRWVGPVRSRSPVSGP